MQKNWKLCILNQQQLWMLAIIIEITGKISTKDFEVLKKINIRPNMQIDMPKTAILKTCSIIGRVLTESSHSTWDTRFSLFLYIFLFIIRTTSDDAPLNINIFLVCNWTMKQSSYIYPFQFGWVRMYWYVKEQL